MSNVVYVRLKDRGTIFHDASQDASVTGADPAPMKLTKKVKDFIRNGNLIEVEEKEALKLIANSTKDKEVIAKAHNATESANVKKLKADLAAERKLNDELTAQNESLQEQLDNVPAAELSDTGELAALQAKWDKAQPYIKGLQTQIKNLKEGAPAPDVDEPDYDADANAGDGGAEATKK